jgi:hypothetical protein
MLILIFLQILVYLIAPPPETVEGFFALYRQNPFLGLLSLDFLYLLNNLILVVLYSALFVLLFRERPVTVLLAFLFGLIGVACYYPSNPAFEMLTLSGGFFQAQSEQQPIYLAAGEALLAGYTGTSFNAYYVLSTLGLLLYAAALLKSPRAKKSLGIWAFTSGLFMIIPSSAGTVGMVFSFLSLMPWVIFIALLMLRFKQLAAVAEPDSIIIENAASSS